ncbi:MAG: single-stranded DNA-binding protein [Lachnospiraceae bacterium]
MNKVDLTGRLTKDPQSRWTNGQESQEQICIVRFTLAVNRRKKDAGADFISCVAFGKSAESLEKYCKKGTKLEISGRIQTGSYTNKDGGKVYTTDVIVEDGSSQKAKRQQGSRETSKRQHSQRQTQTAL